MTAVKQALKWTLILLLVAIPIWAWFNYQNIEDWIRLRGYQPSPRISQVASATTMSEYGKRLFYVNNPQLQNKELFRQNCSDSEKSIVLGCYINNKGIFIFDVSDERLSGVLEVTSAHEMLHVAYERLSDDERAKIDNMTAEVFATVSSQRIKDTIERYRSKDVSIVPNELHSILGTEVRSLTPDLEKYYSRYFSNRPAIVQLSENYEKVFTEREKQIEVYDKKLEELKTKIDQMQKSLETQSQDLARQRAELEQMLASNQDQAYNNAVPGFNALVASYNNGVKQVKQLVDEYNIVVIERNAVASEEQELLNSIDTRLTPESEE